MEVRFLEKELQRLRQDLVARIDGLLSWVSGWFMIVLVAQRVRRSGSGHQPP